VGKAYRLICFSLVFLLVLPFSAAAASIVGSRHDLSWGAAKTGDHGLGGLENYNEVCVYCHTPHGANPSGGPLWNKDFTTSAASYTVYSSATLNSTASAPGALSLLCLNCHDGATGVSTVRNAPNSGWTNTIGGVDPGIMDNAFSFGHCGLCHDPGGFYGPSVPDFTKAFLGTDLSDDHPIGIAFPDPGQDDGFNLPGDAVNGWSDVPLFNGKVECTTCHDVHDPQNVPFLTISNTGSALCTRCHTK
jgi:predicted CXXCH cytochrome family protein